MNLEKMSKPDLSKIVILPETIEALKLSIWMDLNDPFDPYVPRMAGDYEDVYQDLLDSIGESVEHNKKIKGLSS